MRLKAGSEPVCLLASHSLLRFDLLDQTLIKQPVESPVQRAGRQLHPPAAQFRDLFHNGVAVFLSTS